MGTTVDGYHRATTVWCAHYGFDIDPTAFTKALKREKVANTRAASGVENVLSALADDVTLGVLTNGAGDIQRAKLERHDLDGFFESILISGELDTMKPEDAMFHRATERLDADHYVYVADHLAFDIVPAQENGLTGVLVAETPSPVADLTVSSPVELTLDQLHSQV